MKKFFFAITVAAVVAVFFFRVQIKDFVQDLTQPRLPEPHQAEEFAEKKSKAGTPLLKPDNKNTEAIAQNGAQQPEEINLNIPFGSQAPFANWDLPYQEACEEAAAIMVHYYYEGKELTPKIMDEEILKLIEWENKTFGYYEDATAEEIARIMREYFGHKNVAVRYEFTIEDIKKEIAQGRPVILPAAGRLLNNPNFRQPGPIYHALVAKGYTNEKIITNDPGTRKGKNFLYDPKVLMNALHEWNEENILQGKHAMVVAVE
ncbi:C39 family peptidase [Candidatus Peregrinibacteria bacterium]|nr:C39 family peptidase [Candidatus Peregrinibacteria bacterium]